MPYWRNVNLKSICYVTLDELRSEMIIFLALSIYLIFKCAPEEQTEKC